MTRIEVEPFAGSTGRTRIAPEAVADAFAGPILRDPAAVPVSDPGIYRLALPGFAGLPDRDLPAICRRVTGSSRQLPA